MLPEISWDDMPECSEGCKCGEIVLGKTQLDWLLETAFQAGRESAYDRNEWRVVGREGQSARPMSSTIEAFRELGFWRRTLGDPNAYLEHRRTGATTWQRVDQAGERQQYEAVTDA